MVEFVEQNMREYAPQLSAVYSTSQRSFRIDIVSGGEVEGDYDSFFRTAYARYRHDADVLVGGASIDGDFGDADFMLDYARSPRCEVFAPLATASSAPSPPLSSAASASSLCPAHFPPPLPHYRFCATTAMPRPTLWTAIEICGGVVLDEAGRARFVAPTIRGLASSVSAVMSDAVDALLEGAQQHLLRALHPSYVFDLTAAICQCDVHPGVPSFGSATAVRTFWATLADSFTDGGHSEVMCVVMSGARVGSV
jgi:hypothetical protein